MIRRAVSLCLAVGAAAAAVVGVASPAQALPAVKFSTFVADPSGADTSSNAQLVRETIAVTNTTAYNQKLAGYTIRDVNGFVFTFPSTFVLKPRATVVVHTGKGTNTAAHLYWQRTTYVWNNTGDTAYLKKGATLVHSCKYVTVRTGTKSC